MKLTEELKDKVDKTKTKEEAKQTIENAGMILDDAELDQVAGGGGPGFVPQPWDHHQPTHHPGCE